MGYSLQPHIRRQRGPSKPHTRLRQVSEAGLRFYNPPLGRWLSRDPIGELGGLNNYGFCASAPLMRFDIDGRGWAPHKDVGPNPLWPRGATQADTPPTVTASVDPDTSCKGCYRLSVTDVNMDIWWWPGVMPGAAQHEWYHLNAWHRETFLATEAYANSKAGCYNKRQAECWLKVITDPVPKYYYARGAYYNLVVIDGTGDDGWWAVAETYFFILQGWERLCPTL